METYERKLQKYNKLLGKYEEKVQKIAQKFTEDLCKAIGAEQICSGDKRYTHIIFEDIKYQAGSHDLDYYRGYYPTLKEYLEEKVRLENNNGKNGTKLRNPEGKRHIPEPSGFDPEVVLSVSEMSSMDRVPSGNQKPAWRNSDPGNEKGPHDNTRPH